MSELADDGEPVAVTCRVLKLARQPHDRWLAAPVGARERDEAHLSNASFDADRDDPEVATGSCTVRRRRDVGGCVAHPDRCSQFRSFFSLLQNTVLHRRRWTTRAELRLAIITWIERTYHRRRRQARLGRLTPIKLETIMTTQVARA